MSRSKRGQAIYRLVLSFSVVALATGFLWFGMSSNTASAQVKGKEVLRKGPSTNSLGGGTTFPGMGTGLIPDGSGTCEVPASDLDVTFAVSGVSSISTVEVDMDLDHTWVGDVSATLIAPSGESHILFRSTGWTDATSCFGDSSDLGGVYSFSDTATTNWWSEADLRDGATILTPGAYRTTEAGGDTQTMDPAPVTSMDPVFQPTGTINGTWTLKLEDWAGGDSGGINSANLTFNANVPTAQAPPNDFDGDGNSDYSIVRNQSTPLTGDPSPPFGRRSIQDHMADRRFRPLQQAGGENLGVPGGDLAWYIHNSGSNTARVDSFGNPNTDFWVPEDFDGDGQDDVAVWRGLAPNGPMGGAFYIFQSSDSSVVEIDFGIQGDNPTVSGDYDGDGTSDPAVFRCPSGGGQCTFFYRGSAGGGQITFFNWGNDSANEGLVFPYPGDFDGDGRFDFCVWDDNAVYNLFRSSDGGTEYIQWGLTTDPVLAPGDYDGDGRTDFMNVRVNGTDVEWWSLERDGGQRTVVWGALIAGFAEFVAQGDFDGDGATDIGIWRRDENSNSNSFFYTLLYDGMQLQTLEWGSMNDAPVPGWNSQ